MPFLSGYTLRKAITIDHANVDSDLTDFPLLVKFTDDADIGADIDSGGLNIRFTSSDGTTLLKYERQSFDNTGSTATGIFWVKVPTVQGASNTTIYIYFKGGATTDGEDAENVWVSSCLGVWHMEQDPSGSAPQILDSTSNGNHATSHGSMTSGDLVAGKIGNCIDFDGSDDYLSLASTINAASDMTYSGWINPPIYNSTLFGAEVFGYSYIGLTYSNGNMYAGTADATDQQSWSWSNNGVLTYVAMTKSGTTLELYYDGVSQGTRTLGGTLTRVDHIGRGQNGTYHARGTIEEARIANVVKSAAWIKFEYFNINEADNELSFGSLEEAAGGPHNLINAGLINAGLINCEMVA